MSTQSDVEVLRSAGIEDVDELIHSAAEYVREKQLYRSSPHALSEHEQRILKAGGAVWDDDERKTPGSADNLLSVISQYALMIESALKPREVSKKLKVSESRVRQRSGPASPSLYAIRTGESRVYPEWQFADSKTIPYLDRILEILSADAHPLAVELFFLTPNRDLESDQVGTVLSPRDWLLAGHNPEPVLMMVHEL